MTVATPPGSVGFLVVGSPRSGTTLVQRLACEIPGVAMPPETHFFSDFAGGLVTNHRFPLRGRELADAVRSFAEAEPSSGLDIDVDAVVSDLGGTCLRPFDLFEALVRHLAGPAEIWGEKTPNHLVWWRPINAAAPWMRFVAVVRDPRAVVASNLDMPWRTDPTLPTWGDQMHLAFAELWRFFQIQTLAMAEALGPTRCLVVRYEDVVKDPDATRGRLAHFLGRPLDGSAQTAPAGIVLPWESWKAQALDPVADDRVAMWREQLDRRRATEIALVCHTPMAAFDYNDDVPTRWEGVATGARRGPLPWLRLARYARARRVRLGAIERYRL
jgi:hypothetical protein